MDDININININYWPIEVFTSYFGIFWFGVLPMVYLTMVWIYNTYGFTQTISPTKPNQPTNPKPNQPTNPKTRYWMVRWNVFISTTSLIGFMFLWRNFPIINIWKQKCFTCSYAWILHNRYDTYAVFVFMILKPVEFLDTIFLILNKKQISSLHWIHHTTVTLFCWHSAIYASNLTAGALFALMNYFVHSIMYGYYAIRSLGINPSDYGLGKRIVPILITSLQILQMILGFIIMIQIGIRCSSSICNSYNTIFGLGIYGTYFYLFVSYFVKRYR